MSCILRFGYWSRMPNVEQNLIGSVINNPIQNNGKQNRSRITNTTQPPVEILFRTIGAVPAWQNGQRNCGTSGYGYGCAG